MFSAAGHKAAENSCIFILSFCFFPMKGFFGGESAYYAVAMLSLAYMATGGSLIPSSCGQIPLEGKYIWLPESVSQVFDGSIVNLHFGTMQGNEISLFGYVSGQKIQNMECGRSQNYDYEVWMSDVNAISLAISDKPISTFQKLRRSGEIKVEARGEENQKRLDDAAALEKEDNEPVPATIRRFFEGVRTANALAFLPF
jgi:hypothetical protein